jgi:hypothetical protein
MKRKLALATLLAVMLVLGLAVTAMAAGPGLNWDNDDVAPRSLGQQAGNHGLYIDVDGDGACDNYATREPAQDGTGKQWGSNNQAGQRMSGARLAQQMGRQGRFGLSDDDDSFGGRGGRMGGNRWSR